MLPSTSQVFRRLAGVPRELGVPDFVVVFTEKRLASFENQKIRKTYQDARIHFVLNCASESCPILRPELPTGEDLEDLLASSATDFVSDTENVSFDHDRKTVLLSTIFKWYEKDFLNDLRLRGRPTERGLIDYVASVAPMSMQTDLTRAEGYDIVFKDYDWTLNNRNTAASN